MERGCGGPGAADGANRSVIICVKMANCVQCGRKMPPFSFGKKLCQWCVQHEAAQRGEDSPVQRVEPAPWMRRQSGAMAVTQGIFGINAAVFAVMTLAVGATVLGDPAWQTLSLRLGANYGPYTVGGQWWRLLAYMFIHGGLLHIGFNMWCLWNLGKLAEAVYGQWTFAAVYLITGVAAGLNSLAWHFNVPSVGASGAIFGIAGALIASFYLGEFSMPRAAMSGMLRSVVTFVAYNLFFGAAIAHTDNAAHCGGLVMGLILGALIARVAPQEDDVPRRLAVLLVGVLLLAGGITWLQHSHAYISHGQNGVELLKDGNTDAAIAELKKSIKQRPNFAASHSALARAYVARHDFQDAAAEMERVVALSPRDEEAYYRLGVIYMEQKLPSRAEKAFSEQLKIDPNNSDGHFGLAGALASQQRDREALEEYKEVAAAESSYPNVYYNMGVMQARLHLYDDAIASLLEQRKAGDDADCENLLAEIYAAKGMRSEAAAARLKAKQFQTAP